jgi:hypothetical protein
MPPTGHPTIRVDTPLPNGVLKPGDVLTVAGVATGVARDEPHPGHPGHDPVLIHEVTVALAGPSTDAALIFIPPVGHQPPGAKFSVKLTVPTVLGPQQLAVVAQADNGTHAIVNVPVVIHGTPPLWGSSQVAPPRALPQAARLAAIAKPVGCEFWWIGKDGTVHGVYADAGTGWATYQLAGPGSAAPEGGITAVSKGGDVMEVWWIGKDGSIQAAYHEGDWKRYTLAPAGRAAVGGGIAGIFKGGDVMEVWWVAPDGSVQGAYHEGEWKYYTLAAAGSASLSGSIAAVWKGNDVMEVWWIGPDGSVRAAYHEGGWKYYTLAGPHAAALTGGITAVFKGGDVMEVWWVAPDGSVAGATHDGGWQTYVLAPKGSASTHCRITSTYGSVLTKPMTRVWWVGTGGTTHYAVFDGQWSIAAIGSGASPLGAIVGVFFSPDTPTAFWARPDGSLVDAFPPAITLATGISGGRGLRGTVWLTLRQDGSSRWTGDLTNDELYGYDYALSVYAVTGTSADIGAAHHGHVDGTIGGSSQDGWNEEHVANPLLANALAAYRFSALTVTLEHSVDVVNYIETAIDGVFEVAVAMALGSNYGSVVLLSGEIITTIKTGSPVPGVLLAQGVPWLIGPGGLYLRLFGGSTGRQLTQGEYDWANDMVFRGALPPRESFQITDYKGGDDREFTFPTLGGLTLVNLGPIFYDVLRKDNQKTVIHELTHVCQIAHSHDLVFTAQAMASVIEDKSSDGAVYDYHAAGFDYTHLGLEAQAQVVEDWFNGGTVLQIVNPPDDRNQSKIPMDALSPYYTYIVNNVRVGHF